MLHELSAMKSQRSQNFFRRGVVLKNKKKQKTKKTKQNKTQKKKREAKLPLMKLFFEVQK